MNKKEYMEIVIDYLDKNVTEDERVDILRDVDEMISEGIAEGKTEEEIVSKLGSPKQLVKELKGNDIGLDRNGECIVKEVTFANSVNDIKKIKINSDLYTKAKSVAKRLFKIGVYCMALGIVMPIEITMLFCIIGMIFVIGGGVAATILMIPVNMPIVMCGIFGTLICFGLELIAIDIFRAGFGLIRTIVKSLKKLIFNRG